MLVKLATRQLAGRSRARTAGFTLIEVTVGLVVAMITILGLFSTLSASSSLRRQSRDFADACRAVQVVHESLRRPDLDAQVADYLAAPNFTLGEMEVEVRFPEEVLVDLLGGPVPAAWRYRDLDGDGTVELDPGSLETSSLVPVSVLVRWARGEMQSTFWVTER